MIKIRCGVAGSKKDKLYWPVLEFRAIDFDVDVDCEACVFTSPRAVEAYFSKRKLAPQANLAAVGPVTAEALQKKVDAAVVFPCDEAGLAETLEILLQKSWRSVAIFCALDGVAERIAKKFIDRLSIEVIPVYRLISSSVPCPISQTELTSTEVVFECLSGEIFKETWRRLCFLFSVEHLTQLPKTIRFDCQTETARRAYAAEMLR